MEQRSIGKAQCLATLSFRTDRNTYRAGVVRIGNKNKVIVVQVRGKEIIRPVALHNRPGELDRNPVFSPWEMATLDETKKILSGEISTACGGASLGSAPSGMYRAISGLDG